DVGGGEAWMPHRGPPKVPSAEEVSAGFSPLYGRKKGASAQFARARSPLARLRATPARPAAHAPGAKHRSESAGEKRLRPRGECAPEPLVVTNTDATVYGKDMRAAFGRLPPAPHAYRAHVTAQLRHLAVLWETIAMPDLTLIATVTIFIATYAVVAVGKVPVYRIDRAGAALLGGSLIIAMAATFAGNFTLVGSV